MSLEEELTNLVGAVEELDSDNLREALAEGLEGIRLAIEEGFEKLTAAVAPKPLYAFAEVQAEASDEA